MEHRGRASCSIPHVSRATPGPGDSRRNALDARGPNVGAGNSPTVINCPTVITSSSFMPLSGKLRSKGAGPPIGRHMRIIGSFSCAGVSKYHSYLGKAYEGPREKAQEPA